MTTEADDIQDQTGNQADFDPADFLEDLPLVCCNEAVMARMADMLDIQDGLNCKFVGEQWKEDAAEHTRIDYLPTILDEAAELLRSNTQWKFWKKPSPPDIANAKLELVDMLHFAMSEELAKSGPDGPERVASEMAAGYEFTYQTVADGDSLPTPTNVPVFNFQKHKSALFRYLASVFLHYEATDGTSSDVWYPSLGPEQEPVEGEEALEVLSGMGHAGADWSAFWGIALHLGMTFDEVYLTYIAKVSLNELRIANGQKEGTYHKMWWRGLEDNHFLMSALDFAINNNGVEYFNRGAVASWLQTTYTSFVNGGHEPLFVAP
jgi:hypothetical protein